MWLDPGMSDSEDDVWARLFAPQAGSAGLESRRWALCEPVLRAMAKRWRLNGVEADDFVQAMAARLIEKRWAFMVGHPRPEAVLRLDAKRQLVMRYRRERTDPLSSRTVLEPRSSQARQAASTTRTRSPQSDALTEAPSAPPSTFGEVVPIAHGGPTDLEQQPYGQTLEERVLAREFLAQMPSKTDAREREILLAKAQGESSTAIAGRLGLSSANIDQIASRARKRLLAAWSGEDETP